MTWRVRIEPDAVYDGISIQVARKIGDHVEQVKYRSDHQIVGAGEAAVAMPEPSLKLTDDLGRALLDALAAYYGGTTGGLQRRADFEHERRRVDRLMAHLTGGGVA